MSPLCKEIWQDLLVEVQGGVAVSLYVPTFPGRLDRQQELPIMLSNFIDQAEKRISLLAPAMRTPDVLKMLQPARDLAKKGADYWKHQKGGLAFFLGPGFHFLYALNYEVNPLLEVSNRFYIRPLLPAMSPDGRFLLLALSQKQVRFFCGDAQGVSEITVRGMPRSLQEAMAYDQSEKQLQFSGAAGAPGRAGRGSVIFFGHGAPESYKKDALHRFCQQINNALWPELRHETAPLVLACVDYLFPIYQETNRYSNLIPDFIPGNPDRLSDTTLHEKATGLLASRKPQPYAPLRENLSRLLKLGRASIDGLEIVIAAAQGRVEELWTAEEARLWGHFDQQSGEAILQQESTATNQELINLAAIFTLAKGGSVHAVPQKHLPPNLQVAAFYRY